MAITDTKQAKDFTAGAPNIKLKGDLRPMKMASEPDMMDERNELSLRLFGKELKLLTPEEMDMLNEEAERLMQKYMADGGRAQYGLGSLVKSVKKGIKSVVKGVGKVAKSPLGLAAIGLGINQFGIPFMGGKGQGFLSNLFTKGGTLSNLLNLKEGADKMNALKVAGAGSVITGLLAGMEQQEGESDMDFAQRRAQVKDQLNVQFRRLYPQGGNESDEDYDVRISALVEGADDQTVPVGEMADGGRVQYGDGSVLTLMDGTKVQIPEGAYKDGKFKDIIYSSSKGDLLREEIVRGLSFAVGGRVSRAFGSDKLVEKASGIEGLPINVNSKGVKELDLRETGGFIPPVGVKEKADDIPAMLSNNEFVFTADAVRAAGGGSVNKGAQRMYDLMKNLESKVV